VTVHQTTLDDIWFGSVADAANIKPITFGGRSEEPALTPQGEIMYLEPLEDGVAWLAIRPDGSQPRRLAVNTGAGGRDFHLRVSPDGRYVVFNSERSGKDHIWRADLDGQNPKQLTNSMDDALGFPDVSPDGKWVVYSKLGAEKGIWKVAIDGGEPVRMNDEQAGTPIVSPDGKWIAYHYRNFPGKPPAGIAIMPFTGGPAIRRFELSFQYARLRWTPDSRSILFIRGQNRVSNLWSQPIAGGAPKQITYFNADQIYGFDLSPDGKNLALWRGRNTRDVVIIRDLN